MLNLWNQNHHVKNRKKYICLLLSVRWYLYVFVYYYLFDDIYMYLFIIICSMIFICNASNKGWYMMHNYLFPYDWLHSITLMAYGISFSNLFWYEVNMISWHSIYEGSRFNRLTVRRQLWLCVNFRVTLVCRIKPNTKVWSEKRKTQRRETK